MTMVLAAKILVVDDDSVRSGVEEALREDGYQVVAVESGEAALVCIAAQEFDLALIDLKMRGVGGMEVLSTLRRQSPDTAAIVFTAYASLDTAVEALRQGAHDYLFKPCKMADLRTSVQAALHSRRQELRQHELLAQVERSLGHLEALRTAIVEQADPAPPGGPGPAQEPARFLRQGGLIVDLARHVVTLDGHLLELSPAEFDLLAYLAGEAPRVVPPQELVSAVLGYESEAWEARDIARNHVYRIRQKMRAAAGRADAIRTVRGVGYTMGA